jgi:hypothetical protein
MSEIQLKTLKWLDKTFSLLIIFSIVWISVLFVHIQHRHIEINRELQILKSNQSIIISNQNIILNNQTPKVFRERVQNALAK